MGLLDKSLASWIEKQDAKNAEKIQFCDWSAGSELTKSFVIDQHGLDVAQRMGFAVREQPRELKKSLSAGNRRHDLQKSLAVVGELCPIDGDERQLSTKERLKLDNAWNCVMQLIGR